MRAALRDARRAEAIRDRPKGSTMAHEALGRRGPAKAPVCSTCGTDMTDAGLGGSGGVCSRCAGRAQAERNAVIRQRTLHARAQTRSIDNAATLPPLPRERPRSPS